MTGDLLKRKITARILLENQPPFDWFDITEDIAERFSLHPTRDNLISMLDAWAQYWSWAWGDKPPQADELLNFWQEITAIFEVREENGVSASKFADLEKALMLREWGEAEFFPRFDTWPQYTPVVTTELCFLKDPWLAYRAMQDEYEKDLTGRWFEMLLVNRLMIALEYFVFRISITAEWTEHKKFNLPHEVIVGILVPVLDLYKETRQA